MTKDENGHKKGNLVVVMDAGLAAKLNDFIGMTQDCDDGNKFNVAHPGAKREAGTFGRAICVNQHIVSNAGKGAPLGDVVMLKHDQMSIVLKQSAGKAKDAIFMMKDFVIAYGPMLAIPEDLVEQVGLYLAAIIIDAVVTGVAIGAQTVLDTDLWALEKEPTKPKPSPSSTPTSSSKQPCPDPTQTPVSTNTELTIILRY